MTGLEYISRIEALRQFLSKYNHADCVTVEGQGSLEEFIDRSFAMPRWVMWLFHIRKILAVILRLRHDEFFQDGYNQAPQEIPKQINRTIGPFIVRAYEPDSYYVLESGEDRHLEANLIYAKESKCEGNSRFHILTIVRYKHWTGRLYFAIVLPFHYLIIHQMSRQGLRN
ncbi:MAG: DUF2867 domain-containing protein [Candidatus Zixiibacteriota bacterium]